MKSRQKYLLRMIFPLLLAVGIMGCSAEAGASVRAERAAGTEGAEPAGTAASGAQRASGLEAGTAASGAHMICPTASRQPGPKNRENGSLGSEEAGVTSSASVPLAVTDHRVNGAAVKEYADRDSFLREYGFDGQDPWFAYVTEDGGLQLELYYDRVSGLGCGLRYYSGEDMEPEGFLFNGSNNYRYYTDFMDSSGMETDRYSTISFYGYDGRDEAEDYEESVLYDTEERLVQYTSQGWISWLTEKKEIQKILEIKWTYREDGTLQERDYWHNGMVFGTWYSSRQSYYDEQERLVYEHCYVTHGSVDFYYIYAGESEVPVYCLVIDHNTGLLCAELLEYHDAGTGTQGGETDAREPETDSGGMEMYYGRIGPGLAGETENRYATAVIELAEKEGKDHDGYVTHTYAADYDGDSMEEAFVIFGKEVRNEYEYGIYGDCFFVNSDLEISQCIDRACAFAMNQQFLCQEGITYLLICYTIGNPWQGELYTVRDQAAAEVSGSYANKYVDWQGQIIQIQDAYDGNCWWVNLSAKKGEEEWEPIWAGHTWKPYTFILEHGELKEVPAREVTREKVEQIAPLPEDFDEIAEPESIKQYILRDNGELNINMAVESDYVEEGGMDVDFSYVTYRLNDGRWEFVERQMGYYLIQFSSERQWDYVEELYQRYGQSVK